MNKQDFVDSFWTKIRMENSVRQTRSHRKIPVTRQQARALLEAVFEAMEEALERGEEISVPRFGKFSVKRHPDGATIRHPVSGEKSPRPAGKMHAIKFKASSVLVDRVNQTLESAA